MSNLLEKAHELGLSNNQLALIGAGVGALLVYAGSRKSSRKTPPGPPPAFLIGNLLDFPSGQEWFTYTKWGKLYGDLTYCNVAGTKVIVVNGLRHIKALLDERGSNFSERPSSYFANEMLGWKDSPIMHGASHPWFKPCEYSSTCSCGARAREHYAEGSLSLQSD